MKTTRNLTVKDRVFSLDDLQRLANLVGAEYAVASEAGDHCSGSFAVDFADETRIEVDDPAVVSDELLARPARALKVEFEYYNYATDRRIHLELRHGSSSWDNSLRIAGEDRAWVDAQFLALKEAIETARPQASAPRRFQTLILHSTAIGIGTLGSLAIELLMGTVLVRLGFFDGIEPLSEDSKLRATIISIGPILYVMLWLWRWLLGLAWGAFAVRSWLLELWPSVEFSIGPQHHHVEAQRRRRLATFVSLVLIPVAIAIAYDTVRYAF